MSIEALAPLVLGVLDRHSPLEGMRWYHDVVTRLQTGYDRAAFFEAFAAVARRMGKASLTLTPEERDGLGPLGAAASLEGWTVDALGRAGLLVAVSARAAETEFDALVRACFQQGEIRERYAVLRSLSLLPKPERFLSLAVEACRSHVQDLFEAIACENPYPATYFPEPQFNQMVLKALFLGVSLGRIGGLQTRLTTELARMALAYESERRAAGRSVPSDIGLVTTDHRSVS